MGFLWHEIIPRHQANYIPPSTAGCIDPGKKAAGEAEEWPKTAGGGNCHKRELPHCPLVSPPPSAFFPLSENSQMTSPLAQ